MNKQKLVKLLKEYENNKKWTEVFYVRFILNSNYGINKNKEDK